MHEHMCTQNAYLPRLGGSPVKRRSNPAQEGKKVLWPLAYLAWRPVRAQSPQDGGWGPNTVLFQAETFPYLLIPRSHDWLFMNPAFLLVGESAEECFKTTHGISTLIGW